MNTRRVPLYSSIVLLFLLPTLAYAQGFLPLVPPCNNPATNGAHSICGLCDFYLLIQHIVNFLIWLSIPIAVFLFVYAGFLLFTSAGNSGKITQAKKIFTSAFIGFLIAISGWLLVQTIINALVNPTYLSGWSWNTLSCANTNRPGITGPHANITVSDWLNGVLGNMPTPTPVSVVGTPPSLNPTCNNGTISSNNNTFFVSPTYCAGICTDAKAKSAIAAYNASQGGRTSTVTVAPGVRFDGLDPALLQDILNNVSAAKAGGITITSGSNGTHVSNSQHYAGEAVDIGFDNTLFNNFIENCGTQTYTFATAYEDSANWYWTEEPGCAHPSTCSTKSTGLHWHVSIENAQGGY